MELNVNLLKRDKKSFFRVGVGILFIIISCLLITAKITHEEVIKSFEWFYYGAIALGGIIYIVEGLFALDTIFGKAYILINSELISLKPEVFNKEQSVYWNDIKSIDYKHNKLRIKTINDTNVIINLFMINFVLKQEIRRTIDCIAKEKSIIYHE